MSDTAAGNENTRKKGPKETVEELKELVVGYARQETVEPLKRLGLWVGYGIGGALLVSIGLIIMSIGGLRALQTQTGEHLTGSLTWVPYAITVGGLAIVMGIFAALMTRSADHGEDAEERR